MERFILTAALMGIGCDVGQGDAAAVDAETMSDMEDALAGELDAFAESATSMSAGFAQLGDDGGEVCEQTIGTCSFCAGYDGTPLSGTLLLEVKGTPCGGAWDGAASWTYTIEESRVDGEWALIDRNGTYQITASGSRAATIEVTPPRGETRMYDAGWALVDFDARVLGSTLESYTMTLTYDSFGDHRWAFTVEVDGDRTISGSVSVDDVLECTVSGTIEAPIIDCGGVGEG